MIIGSAMLCKRAFFLRPKWPCFHKAEREDGSEAEHGSTWPVIGQGQGTSVVVALQSQNEIRSVMEPFWAVNSNALKRAGGLVQVREVSFLGFGPMLSYFQQSQMRLRAAHWLSECLAFTLSVLQACSVEWISRYLSTAADASNFDKNSPANGPPKR